MQPFYCEGVGDGLCRDVAVGAAQSLVAQTSLYVSMLLCMAFAKSRWVSNDTFKSQLERQQMKQQAAFKQQQQQQFM